ncbi:MAG: cation diffusion facilitator family transporter, partial [Candidatus Hodarchaeota archaeon]
MSKNAFSQHLFQFRSVEKKKLLLSLIITTTVMILEIVGGLMTNSIALLSDAGHMFTHSFAIGISLLAIFIARKPPCHHKTFGLFRAEVLAAFINGLFLLP